MGGCDGGKESQTTCGSYLTAGKLIIGGPRCRGRYLTAGKLIILLGASHTGTTMMWPGRRLCEGDGYMASPGNAHAVETAPRPVPEEAQYMSIAAWWNELIRKGTRSRKCDCGHCTCHPNLLLRGCCRQYGSVAHFVLQTIHLSRIPSDAHGYK
jgi:hypothetical protein